MRLETKAVADILVNDIHVAYADSEHVVCGGTAHWAANNSGEKDPSCTATELNPNERYKLTFRIDEDGQYPVAEDARSFSFYYLQCESGFNPVEDGFYCINGWNPGNNKNDLDFVWNKNQFPSFRIEPDAFSAHGEAVNAVITSGDWLVPHNLDMMCGSDTGCLDVATRVTYFCTARP